MNGCRLDAAGVDVGDGLQPVLDHLAQACADVLTETAVRDGRQVGWLSWQQAGAGPAKLRAGGPGLYDGDAGTAWACALLARALHRPDLAELAERGVAHAVRQAFRLRAGGLLHGRSGVLAAARGVATELGAPVEGADELEAAVSGDLAGWDVGDGVAGWLLAVVACGLAEAEAVAAVGRLAAAARSGAIGPAAGAGAAAPTRALCGLAAGNAGVAWALAEAACAYPRLAQPALTLAGRAVRWEDRQFDATRHGWPDLRVPPASFPALWCHGAAGIGAVRIRLLQLLRAGVAVPVGESVLIRDVVAAARAATRELDQLADRAERFGRSVLAHGLTVCHGAGGPLDLLLSAAQALDEPAHLLAARRFAIRLAAVLGDDPITWPGGLGGPSASLHVGLAGTALVLSRAAYPDRAISAASQLPITRSDGVRPG